MGSTNARRGAAAFAVVLGTSLVLAACGGSSGGGGGSSASGKAPGLNKAECAPIKSIMTEYGDLSGKTVSVYTSIVAPEDQPQKDSYKLFETCTGAKVNYESEDGPKGPAAASGSVTTV